MSTGVHVKSGVDIQRLPVNSDEQKFQDWIIKYTKSHILPSQCSTADKCAGQINEKCPFCL